MSFTCPKCGRTSHHPKDEEHRYCSACNEFFQDGSEKAQQLVDYFSTDKDEVCQSRLRRIRVTRQLRWRYWNANGFAVAIIAKEGDAQDWTAYIGGTQGLTLTEYQTADFVLSRGCKIDRKMAEVLFPEFKAAGLEWRE